MNLIKRMENKEAKLEKKIDIKLKKIEDINLKFHNGEILRKKYNTQKKRIEEKIKMMNIHLRTLSGEVAKKRD
jgi:hypothetical protein